MRKKLTADAAFAEVPPGMSTALLQDLHLLTRDGQLNADARRKLKQIRHLLGLLRPAVDDVLARHPTPRIVDCGAGKSYLGFLLYETVLAPAGRGELVAIESRPDLAEATRARAAKFGLARFQVAGERIADTGEGGRAHLVTALHACDTATDDALVLAVTSGADHVALVPCCQAEVARQLGERRATPGEGPEAELFHHAWHRREFGSHLTNVVRALVLEACGYQVTVTEFAGWEHTAKNELILGKRVARQHALAQRRLAALLARFAIEPAAVRGLRAAGIDPAPAAAAS